MPSHVKNYSLLLLLAVLWSGSFAFIKIGVESVGPLTLTWARLSIAAVLLIIWLKLNSIRLPRNLGYWKICAFIGLIGNALPFSLISWGETRIDSGLTAVLMGIMPITTAVLAHIFIKMSLSLPEREWALWSDLVVLRFLLGLPPLRA